MTARYALPLAFVLALAVTNDAHAQADAARDFGCSRPISIATDDESNFQKADGGFTVDMFAEIARRTGCQFDFVQVSAAQNEQALGEGRADIVSLLSTTPRMAGLARFIAFLEPKFLLIMRQDFSSKTMSLDEIVADKRSRIGVVNGQNFASYFQHRIRLLRANDQILEVANPQALFDALRGDQVNGVIVASVVYQMFSTQLERQATFRVVDTSHSGAVPLGISLSRSTFNAQQVDNWFRTIEAMTLDSTMLSLVEKYLPPRLANALVKK